MAVKKIPIGPTNQRTCRFYTTNDSGQLPRLIADKSDSPCIVIAHDWTIDERLVMDMIPLAACLLQRQCRECPRELEENVEETLLPKQFRK